MILKSLILNENEANLDNAWISSREWKFFVAEHAQFWYEFTNIKLCMLIDEKIRFARTNSSSGNPP